MNGAFRLGEGVDLVPGPRAQVRDDPPAGSAAGQKVTSGSPEKSELKLTKKKPKNTTLTSSSTVCHHFGRAVLGSWRFRSISRNGKISAPRLDMFADHCTRLTGSARCKMIEIVTSR